jgi:hypothetical protein
MRRILFEGLMRRPLTETPPVADDDALAELAANVDRAARRRLGRSLSIREVDAGSCNGCELEIHALNNAFYDLERFGLRFVASPRHADVLLVTGPVTRNMREALARTYDATPDRRLRARRRSFFRQLRGGGGSFGRCARRSPYPRLPPAPNAVAHGPAGFTGGLMRYETCRRGNPGGDGCVAKISGPEPKP